MKRCSHASFNLSSSPLLRATRLNARPAERDKAPTLVLIHVLDGFTQGEC